MIAATDTLSILEKGEIALEGQFLWGSNYTLFVEVSQNGQTIKAVYKPARGERPLWDFPTNTLGQREMLAYEVSEELGWHFVPPTVYREEGPHGPGSLQAFIQHDPEYHFFNFTQDDRERLRPSALFDLVINNADRKGGHFLVDEEKHLWLIDHGVCFHEEPKLRTVLWDFAGEAIPAELCTTIAEFQDRLTTDTPLADKLAGYLSQRELTAMSERITNLLASGEFPFPPEDSRPYPWPLV